MPAFRSSSADPILGHTFQRRAVSIICGLGASRLVQVDRYFGQTLWEPERSIAWQRWLAALSRKTPSRKISRSLEAARCGFRVVRSLWNLTGASAAVLPRRLSDFTAIRSCWLQISRLRDFTIWHVKTHSLVDNGLGLYIVWYRCRKVNRSVWMEPAGWRPPNLSWT